MAEVERAVLVGIVRSAAATGVATAPGHLNEAAVKQTPGLGEELVETAVKTAFLGGKREAIGFLIGHGRAPVSNTGIL